VAISIRITVKVPELVIDSRLVRHSIEQKMRLKTGPELQKEFKKTVAGWTNPPRFNPHYHHVQKLSTEVSTDSEKYGYVNNGTPEHPIFARRGNLLWFQPGYRAATRPRIISSQRPQRFGAVVPARFIPMHPGIEPRLFDEVIALEYVDTFVEDMQDAIRLAVVRSASVSRP